MAYIPGRIGDRSILISEYVAAIANTDHLPPDDIRPVLLGLYGEVGSVLAAAKKIAREKEAYKGFHEAVEEEFGDALWYFATLCRRLKLNLADIFAEAVRISAHGQEVVASDLLERPLAHATSVISPPQLHEAFLRMGEAVVPLLSVSGSAEAVRPALAAFASSYLQAVQVARVSFASIVHENISKTRGRFLDPDFSSLPTFDHKFLEEERLPNEFAIEITQRKNGRSHLRWNGVFIGAPLTDNIRDQDGYRFHDVFHLAHAAILHWSPTFRALIHQKRKSDPKVDEAEDGGRAIVVEEGLTAWIFSRAKALDYFKDQRSISFDLLKTVGQFVRGYEVQQCPLALWERAILLGYGVFRAVRDNNGGVVVGNRTARTLVYKPLSKGTQ